MKIYSCLMSSIATQCNKIVIKNTSICWDKKTFHNNNINMDKENNKSRSTLLFFLLIIKQLLRVCFVQYQKYYIRSTYCTRPSVSCNITNSCNILWYWTQKLIINVYYYQRKFLSQSGLAKWVTRWGNNFQ